MVLTSSCSSVTGEMLMDFSLIFNHIFSNCPQVHLSYLWQDCISFFHQVCFYFEFSSSFFFLPSIVLYLPLKVQYTILFITFLRDSFLFFKCLHINCIFLFIYICLKLIALTLDKLTTCQKYHILSQLSFFSVTFLLPCFVLLDHSFSSIYFLSSCLFNSLQFMITV